MTTTAEEGVSATTSSVVTGKDRWKKLSKSVVSPSVVSTEMFPIITFETNISRGEIPHSFPDGLQRLVNEILGHAPNVSLVYYTLIANLTNSQ